MLLYFSRSWAALPRWRLSCRLPGCPPPRFRPPPCPPRPRLRPPCRLLIKSTVLTQCRLPLRLGRTERRTCTASDPLVPICAAKRLKNGRLRRGLERERSADDLERARARELM